MSCNAQEGDLRRRQEAATKDVHTLRERLEQERVQQVADRETLSKDKAGVRNEYDSMSLDRAAAADANSKVWLGGWVGCILHTYIRTCIHAYIHTNIHTYIHTHTYLHTYIREHMYVYSYVHVYPYVYGYGYKRDPFECI